MSERAASGLQEVRATAVEMKAVRDDGSAAETAMHVLVQRATEIGGILDVIDDIADETTLLALNAAIIAAQAGEQGRAFSVVASEVRNLANRVRTSTKDIATMITSVREETVAAAEVVGRGARRAETSVSQAKRAEDSLLEITASVRESGANVATIISSIADQASSTGTVTQGMDDVLADLQQIGVAAREQHALSRSIANGNTSIIDVARKTSGASTTQSATADRIRELSGTVGLAAERLDSLSGEQAEGIGEAIRLLSSIQEGAHDSARAAEQLDGAVDAMAEDSAKLVDAMARFCLSEVPLEPE